MTAAAAARQSIEGTSQSSYEPPTYSSPGGLRGYPSEAYSSSGKFEYFLAVYYVLLALFLLLLGAFVTVSVANCETVKFAVQLAYCKTAHKSIVAIWRALRLNVGAKATAGAWG